MVESASTSVLSSKIGRGLRWLPTFPLCNDNNEDGDNHELIDKVEAVFDRRDKDGDGLLSRQEFDQLFDKKWNLYFFLLIKHKT